MIIEIKKKRFNLHLDIKKKDINFHHTNLEKENV